MQGCTAMCVCCLARSRSLYPTLATLEAPLWNADHNAFRVGQNPIRVAPAHGAYGIAAVEVPIVTHDRRGAELDRAVWVHEFVCAGVWIRNGTRIAPGVPVEPAGKIVERIGDELRLRVEVRR